MSILNIYWDLDGVLRPRPDKTRVAIERALEEHGYKIKIDKEKFRLDWSKCSSYAKENCVDVYEVYIRMLVNKDVQSIVKLAKIYRENIEDPKPFDYTLNALKIIIDNGMNNILITHSYNVKRWLKRYNLNEIVHKVIDGVDVKHRFFDNRFVYIGDTAEDITEYRLARRDGKEGMLYIVGQKLKYKKAIYVADAYMAAINIVKDLKNY